VRDHEKDTPLYVLCRKWVQNDPEAELMPPKLVADDPGAREGGGGAAQLPAVPPPDEEEARAARPPPEEPLLPQQPRDTPPLEVPPPTHTHISPGRPSGFVHCRCSLCMWLVLQGLGGQPIQGTCFKFVWVTLLWRL
jgi:hypothetical protein